MIDATLGFSLTIYSAIALFLVMVGNLAYSLYLRGKVKKQIERDRARLEAYQKSIEASFAGFVTGLRAAGAVPQIHMTCPKCRVKSMTHELEEAIIFLQDHTSHGGHVQLKALIMTAHAKVGSGDPARN